MNPVYLGIDFGTQFIKMVYTHPATGLKHPVVLGDSVTAFLPSVISQGSAPDKIRICSDSGEGRRYRFSKILSAAAVDSRFDHPRYRSEYAEQYGDLPSSAVAAMLIAYAVRHAEDWVREKLKDEYAADELRIFPCVCIPVDYLDKNVVKERFEKILALAEQLLERDSKERFLYSEEVDLGLLREAGQSFDRVAYSVETSRLRYRPEIAAAVHSYVNSLDKARGIPHAVYDVGGGTTELTIFSISADNMVSIYETKIIPQGTLITGESGGQYSQVFDRTEGVWLTAQARHRHDHQVFWRQVRVFVSGGGALIEGINRPFSRSWDNVTGLMNFTYDCGTNFPQPADFVGQHFNRFCVAYGLAVDAEPFVLFPNEIERIARTRPAQKFRLAAAKGDPHGAVYDDDK